MSEHKPLRAVLMKSFRCYGVTFNKGDVYDIAEFRNSCGSPVVYLKVGQRIIGLMPAAIQILASDSKEHKHNNKK